MTWRSYTALAMAILSIDLLLVRLMHQATSTVSLCAALHAKDTTSPRILFCLKNRLPNPLHSILSQHPWDCNQSAAVHQHQRSEHCDSGVLLAPTKNQKSSATGRDSRCTAQIHGH